MDIQARANKLYTAGELKQAAELYNQAFRLSPKPVYLSNLSAAQVRNILTAKCLVTNSESCSTSSANTAVVTSFSIPRPDLTSFTLVDCLSTVTKALAHPDTGSDLSLWSKVYVRSIKCHLQLREWEDALEQIAEVQAADVARETQTVVSELLLLVQQAKEASIRYAEDESRWNSAIVELPRYRPNPIPKLE